jgi:glycosyltransferase involved in cell wall biosynthesis
MFAPVVLSHTPNLIYWAHGCSTGRHWTERWAARTKPAIVVANSQFVGRSVPTLFGPLPTEVIYYPASSALERAAGRSRSEIRRQLGIVDSTTVIVQVSRMEAWKGHMLHLDALARLKRVPGWVCWIVGGAQRRDEEIYVSSLRRHATDQGIADRVVFLGQRGDVPYLLTAADIFCQPNQSPEPFGIVYVEALLAGLPVISTAMGGAAEIVNGSCGMLVPPDNSSALADALRECIENPDLRLRMGCNGPARARQLCDPTTQLQRLYTTVLAQVSKANTSKKFATPCIECRNQP